MYTNNTNQNIFTPGVSSVVAILVNLNHYSRASCRLSSPPRRPESTIFTCPSGASKFATVPGPDMYCQVKFFNTYTWIIEEDLIDL